MKIIAMTTSIYVSSPVDCQLHVRWWYLIGNI